MGRRLRTSAHVQGWRMNRTHDHCNWLAFIMPKEGQFAGAVLGVDERTLNSPAPARFEPFVAFHTLNVEPSIVNMLSAAPQMYGALSQQYQGLSLLLEVFDENHVPEDNKYRTMVQNMQDAILLIQQTAREGNEAVARQILNQRKASR
jgi:hypothetical protein